MDKFVTFGEIMLQLKSPGHERFFQSPGLEATFGGGESNVALPVQDLELVAPAVAEHKQLFGKRIQPQGHFDQYRQPVNTLTEVDNIPA
jgi:hypothetical protein